MLSHSRTPLLVLVLVVALALSAACSNTPAASTTGDEAIIGGVAARSARLDAVGSLGRVKPAGFRYFCTATLIAPRLVITAKHCAADKTTNVAYTDTEAIYFGVGEDSKAPKRTVKAKRTWLAPVNEGGYVARGQDVAILELEERVDGIAPLPVASGHLGEELLGARLSAVGYGVRDTSRSSGARRAGTLTLQNQGGPIVGPLFSDVEALLTFVKSEGGGAFDPSRDEPRVRELWNRSLLADNEIFAGLAAGDAQPCSGDSGGPLLGRTEGGLAVFAVVSGSFKLTNKAINPCSVLGEVYGTFPAGIQAMFDEAAAATDGEGPARVAPSSLLSRATPPSRPGVAITGEDRCAGEPVEGRCEDGVAIRCIGEAEGPPRVTRTDCGLLLQTCGAIASEASTVAECVDPAAPPPGTPDR